MKTLMKILKGFGIFIVVVVLLALFFTQGIADTAKSQLKALRDGDIIKAYSYTSKDFRSSTSLENFQKFVDNYPSLKNNKDVSFSDRETSNGIGKLKGTLKSTDGGSTPIEYELVKENGEWKILSIKLNPAGAGITAESPTSSPQQSSGGTIEKVLFNDKKGERGVVDTNKETFSQTTPEIFVSAYVSNAQKGSQASGELTYIKTGDKIGPATNNFEEGGDPITGFSFSKPTNGWPQGEYKIRIFLSTGDSKEVNFSVE